MPAIASQPDLPAWDVDADWWGPSWDVVEQVGPAEPARPGKPRDVPISVLPVLPVMSASSVVADALEPEVPSQVATDPSWVRILATTVSLWVSRRSSRAGAVERHDVGEPHDAGRPGRARFRRPRVVGWVPAVWRAHARLLSAAMLSAGLLAVGAGTVGLVVAHASAGPSVRMPARPAPVPVPTGRTIAPASLSAVAPVPRPVWLTIPSIGVKAPIVNLGLNKDGTLQVPSTTTVAGWYINSPRPGATGSSVIAGHVDSRSGPGVFFWLRNMRPGQRIYVRRADGTLAVFTVTAIRKYAKSQFPTAMVYGPVPDAELRLITCGGTFDYARHSYLSNVVVYARMSG